jgi:hypothetical protein
MKKSSGSNIVTTLHGTNISEVEERHNDDDDNDIPNGAIEAPNDSDYQEP